MAAAVLPGGYAMTAARRPSVSVAVAPAARPLQPPQWMLPPSLATALATAAEAVT